MIASLVEADALISEINKQMRKFRAPDRVGRMYAALSAVFGTAVSRKGNRVQYCSGGLRYELSICVGKVEPCDGYSPTTIDGSGWASASLNEIVAVPIEQTIWIGHSRLMIRNPWLPGPWWDVVTVLAQRAPSIISLSDRQHDERAELLREEEARRLRHLQDTWAKS